MNTARSNCALAITLRDMIDIEMFRIMGMENSEDWMNPVQHTEQVIKQARIFFDSWLERFPAWADFVKAPGSWSLPEFGARRGNAVQQVAEWLGGAGIARLTLNLNPVTRSLGNSRIRYH